MNTVLEIGNKVLDLMGLRMLDLGEHLGTKISYESVECFMSCMNYCLAVIP